MYSKLYFAFCQYLFKKYFDKVFFYVIIYPNKIATGRGIPKSGFPFLYSRKKVGIMPRGVPRRDGSGRGVRANKGRGGCAKTQRKGKGNNRRR